MNRGFSLLELSIVLVIIGLIAGGIVAGSSMIRAAELRAVITETNQFKIAVHTFRDKYLGIPGDLKNATAFWGRDDALCSTHTGTASTSGTCNGDGDSRVGYATVVSTQGENFMFWQHLSRAELVQGEYTGVAGSGTGFPGRDAVVGENIPASKLSGAGHTIEYVAGDAGWGYNDIGNKIFIGTENSTAAGGPTWYPFLTPQEAWNFDKKRMMGIPLMGV